MKQVQRPCSRFRLARRTEDGGPQTNRRGLPCKRKEGRALQRRSARECRRVLNYREEVQVRAGRRQEGKRVIQVKRKREIHVSEMKEGDVFMRLQ